MVEQNSSPAVNREQGNGTCRHHWSIEASSGPLSIGVCNQCDEVREFRNYIDERSWFDEDLRVQSVDVEKESPVTQPAAA